MRRRGGSHRRLRAALRLAADHRRRVIAQMVAMSLVWAIFQQRQMDITRVRPVDVAGSGGGVEIIAQRCLDQNDANEVGKQPGSD
jgi:hypothetical protein